MRNYYGKKHEMALKFAFNYSPNFSPKKRIRKNIKLLIFHYTGMKSENEAIKRLTDVKSKVSSHYFIKKNGKILLLVPDLYIAWHSGMSYWRNKKSLNKYSIGIEIQNEGHQYNYKRFNSKQIRSLIKLSLFLIKKYKINKKNILGHSDVAYDRKKDPGEKFPWQFLSNRKIGFWHNLKKNYLIKNRNLTISMVEEKKFINYLKKIGYWVNKTTFIIKKKFLLEAFQRRFRPELVNGKIDRECLIIAKKISKLYS